MSVNEIREDKIGRLAENYFERWAIEASIIYNKANYDHGGWDFICQLNFGAPPSILKGKPTLDLLKPSWSVFIQIKATDHGDRAANAPKVKLTNVERFLALPNPCFYLILDFKSSDTPHAAHLVHFNKDWIAKGLKRLRSTPPEKLEQLHEKKMSVKWTDDNRLEHLNGLGFRDAILRSLKGDAHNYSAQKKSWQAEAGYENGKYQFTILTQDETGPLSEEALVNFSLGYTEKLPIHIKEFNEIRFGIPRSLKSAMPTDAFMTIPDRKPLKDVEVEFTRQGTTTRSKIKADFLHSHLFFPGLSEESLCYRFSSRFIDICHKVTTAELTLNYSPPSLDEKVPLEELGQAYELLILFSDNSSNKPIQMRAVIKGETIITQGIPPSIPVRNQEIARIRAVAAAARVSRHLNLQNQEMSLKEIFAQAPSILTIDMALSGSLNETLDVAIFIKERWESEERTSIGFCSTVTIGSNWILVPFVIHGFPDFQLGEEGEGWRLRIKNRVISLGNIIVKDSPDITLEERKQLRISLEQLTERFGGRLVLPDEEPLPTGK